MRKNRLKDHFAHKTEEKLYRINLGLLRADGLSFAYLSCTNSRNTVAHRDDTGRIILPYTFRITTDIDFATKFTMRDVQLINEHTGKNYTTFMEETSQH